ncbi:hypothetical protein SARC_13903 [Sphaeroforma arctica JP610]|uniref:Uncharacterized protein n=1 Tax=Sphaeroforma arctica JP610 TaxID=667725 RepID=A0A0L0FAI7_9EUKA|nr:hypothetical protein SARC_13903 [Sphaeroforma arctica JP610]KNC73536.1 hypothetical protein SARC_13903 [Sphaeroforma arctica JP610]|eukprot:XP_014147438.1 hypothetical protein SARC_13903 [Sphaeroforma arctica JP610]
MLDALNELPKEIEIQAILRFPPIDRRYKFLLMDTFMYKCLGVLGTQDPNLYMDMKFQIHVQVYRGGQKYTVEDTFEWYASTGCIGAVSKYAYTGLNEHLQVGNAAVVILQGKLYGEEDYPVRVALLAILVEDSVVSIVRHDTLNPTPFVNLTDKN